MRGWRKGEAGVTIRLAFSTASDKTWLELEHVYVGRAWYLFSCDHDVIKIGPGLELFVKFKVQPFLSHTKGVRLTVKYFCVSFVC